MSLNWPNRITLLRLFLLAPLGYCLFQLDEDHSFPRRAALCILIVIAMSDALDGYLARRWNQVTLLGTWLDPLADKLVGAITLVLLAIEQTSVPDYVLPAWLPVVALGKDVWTVAGAALVRHYAGTVEIRPRIFGKACTAVQFVLVGYCLVAPDVPLKHEIKRLGLSALCWIVAVLAATAAMDYTVQGLRRLRSVQDPPQE